MVEEVETLTALIWLESVYAISYHNMLHKEAHISLN